MVFKEIHWIYIADSLQIFVSWAESVNSICKLFKPSNKKIDFYKNIINLDNKELFSGDLDQCTEAKVSLNMKKT